METGFFSTKNNKILGSLFLVVLIIALLVYTRYVLKQTEYLSFGPTTISVVGTGEVSTIPDVGKFSFSVTEKAEKAADAQKQSGEKINEIIAFLEGEGVEKKDIKTENYNLYPRFRSEERKCISVYCPSTQVPDGFEVSQSISVKVRNLDKASNILAQIGEKGATNISNLNFIVDDVEVAKTEARSKAIENAKEKAKSLEKELGVKFVKMVDFYEGGDTMPYARDDYALKQESVMMDFSGPVLPAGENMVNSRVTIVYLVN